MDYPTGPSFASLFTVRVRWVLGVLVVLYVVQVGAGDLAQLAALAPVVGGFRFWQPFTYPLYQGPATSAIMSWLVLGFLLESTWKTMGTRRLLLATAAAWFGATLCIVGVGALWAGERSPLVFGLGWAAEAMIVWLALLNRGAHFRLFIGDPIPAMWVAYAFGVLTLLRAGIYRDLTSIHQVFVWCAAWSVLWVDEDRWRWWRLLRRKKKLEAEASRFTVLEGGKSGERPRRSRDDNHLN